MVQSSRVSGRRHCGPTSPLPPPSGSAPSRPTSRCPTYGAIPSVSPTCSGMAPAMVMLYRGSWCSYSNIQLRAYRAVLPQLATLGARLAAISPQLPEQSLSTGQADALTSDVLSGVGNGAARQFGLVYISPEELRVALRSNNTACAALGSWRRRSEQHTLGRTTDDPLLLPFNAEPRQGCPLPRRGRPALRDDADRHQQGRAACAGISSGQPKRQGARDR